MVQCLLVFEIWAKSSTKLCYPQHPQFQRELIGTAYGVNFSRGQLRGDLKRDDAKYCAKCKNGDIIDMYLDFKSMELRYSVNNRTCKRAFDIPQGSYRASVAMFFPSDKLTLLMYKTSN